MDALWIMYLYVYKAQPPRRLPKHLIYGSIPLGACVKVGGPLHETSVSVYKGRRQGRRAEWLFSVIDRVFSNHHGGIQPLAALKATGWNSEGRLSPMSSRN